MKLELINTIYETWQVIESFSPSIPTEDLIKQTKEQLRLQGYAVNEDTIVKAITYKEKRKDKRFIRKEAKLKNQIWTKKQIILALEKPTAVHPQIIAQTRAELLALEKKLKEMRETL